MARAHSHRTSCCTAGPHFVLHSHLCRLSHFTCAMGSKERKRTVLSHGEANSAGRQARGRRVVLGRVGALICGLQLLHNFLYKKKWVGRTQCTQNGNNCNTGEMEALERERILFIFFYCVQNQPDNKPLPENGNTTCFHHNFSEFLLLTISACCSLWKTSGYHCTRQSRPVAIACHVYLQWGSMALPQPAGYSRIFLWPLVFS